MKGIKKILLVSLAFAGLFSCSSSNDNTSADNTSVKEENPEKAQVVANIKANAISEDDGTYMVNTTTQQDTTTFLIYDVNDDAFGLGAYNEYQTLVTMFAIEFDFMDLANGKGAFSITNNSSEVFEASIDGVTVSNHQATNYSYTIILGSDSLNDAATNLMTAMFSLALSDCSTYISTNSLPYIY